MFKERNTMDEIKWEVPPTAKGKYYGNVGKYVAIANALRKRPLEWAIVSGDTQGNLASMIRKGKVKGFSPAGSFEAVSRTNPENTSRTNPRCTVYARFVG
jgi:hypothetical protein